MSLKELPIGLSLTLCDTIIEDVYTRKRSLIGLFSKIYADHFPYRNQPFSALISLTGCVEKFPCHLICVKSSDNKVILDVKCDIDPATPFDVVDMVIVLKSMVFPDPGRYIFKLLVDGVPVMMRPITVVARAAKPMPPEPPQAPKE